MLQNGAFVSKDFIIHITKSLAEVEKGSGRTHLPRSDLSGRHLLCLLNERMRKLMKTWPMFKEYSCTVLTFIRGAWDPRRPIQGQLFSAAKPFPFHPALQQ